MFVTAVGLAVFLYIKPILQPETTFRISSLLKESVQLILISSQYGEIELEQREDGWFMTKPMQARVDKTKVERILDLLAATSEYRLPLDNFGRYGLSAPIVQLQMNHELFAFGQLAPVSNRQYIMTQAGVFLISPHHAALLMVSPTELIDRRLLNDDEIPQEFIWGNIHVKQAEKWYILPEPVDIELSQDDIHQWVHSWRLAQASYLSKSENGSGDTKEKLSIILQTGKQIHFSIVQREPELVLLRGDNLIQYHFLGQSENQLLSPNFLAKHEEKIVD